jgi:hypothetical protein
MKAEQREICAYCGRPLRLVAGFCAACQAPATVAQRARLIADSGMPSAARDVPLPEIAALPMPPTGWDSRDAMGRGTVIITRLLLASGLIALGMVLVAVSVRLNANPIRLLVSQAAGTVVVRQTEGGPATARVVAGQPFVLQYDLTVQADQAAVTLTIAPQSGPSRMLTETWPRGYSARVQTLVPVAPDRWQIMLREDGALIAATAIQIVAPPTTMIKDSSSSSIAVAAIFVDVMGAGATYAPSRI